MIRFPHRVIVPGLVPVTKSETQKLRCCSLPPVPDVQLAAFFSLFIKGMSIEYVWDGIGDAFEVDRSHLELCVAACVPDRDHGGPIDLFWKQVEYARSFARGYPIEQFVEDAIRGFVEHETNEGIRINGRRVREEHPELSAPSRADDAMKAKGSASR